MAEPWLGKWIHLLRSSLSFVTYIIEVTSGDSSQLGHLRAHFQALGNFFHFGHDFGFHTTHGVHDHKGYIFPRLIRYD